MDKIKKIVREEVRKILHEQEKTYTVLLEAPGPVSPKEVVKTQPIQASTPKEAANRAVQSYRWNEFDPNVDLDEVEGNVDGEVVFALAVIEGSPNIPLVRKSSGLR